MSPLIKSILKIAPEFFGATEVQFAYVYGSIARESSHPFSDLDIGVFVEEMDIRSSLDLELSLSLEMDAKLNHTVDSDIRIINHLPLIVQGEIVTTGILIYCKDDAKRIEFETRLRMTYFDFLPAHKRLQRMRVIGAD